MKKEKKTTTTPVSVMDNPEMSSKININLTQDDLIQMAIQTRVEQLEELMKTQEEHLKTVKGGIKRIADKFIEKLKQEAMRLPDYVTFKKL
jgi:predicted small metal-binding protein